MERAPRHGSVPIEAVAPVPMFDDRAGHLNQLRKRAQRSVVGGSDLLGAMKDYAGQCGPPVAV